MIHQPPTPTSAPAYATAVSTEARNRTPHPAPLPPADVDRPTCRRGTDMEDRRPADAVGIGRDHAPGDRVRAVAETPVEGDDDVDVDHTCLGGDRGAGIVEHRRRSAGERHLLAEPQHGLDRRLGDHGTVRWRDLEQLGVGERSSRRSDHGAQGRHEAGDDRAVARAPVRSDASGRALPRLHPAHLLLHRRSRSPPSHHRPPLRPRRRCWGPVSPAPHHPGPYPSGSGVGAVKSSAIFDTCVDTDVENRYRPGTDSVPGRTRHRRGQLTRPRGRKRL